jgi:hypothetical protein
MKQKHQKKKDRKNKKLLVKSKLRKANIKNLKNPKYIQEENREVKI